MAIKQIMVVKLINNVSGELDRVECESDNEVRLCVLEFLDTIQDGDSITFETVLE